MTAEPVPVEPLRAWLSANVEAARGRVRVDHLSGGSSNLTFRVRDDANDWVLRRPPMSHVLATAHDMGREHRVQAALHPTGLPVARMVAYCDDTDVIGAPFYLMERLDGVVYNDADAVAGLSEDDSLAATNELIDVLARLHAVVPGDVGLGDLGRPDGFLERQLHRWQAQWEKSKHHDAPVVVAAAAKLAAALPPEQPAAIVHGDYSFNNTMWHRDRPAVMQALLDWEMATQGDPLTDLGMLVTYWGPVGERLWRERSPQPHRANAGFPGADALVDRYRRTSGRPVDHLPFYVALATYKLAIIVAGGAARMAATNPERAARSFELTEELAERALDALG